VSGLARPQRDGALVALAAVVSGLLCWAAYRLPPATTSDFDQFWVAGRALLTGADPYAVVPTTGTHAPLFYPLTAALVGVPFAGLSLEAARVAWAALSGAALAWAAIRWGRGLPAALVSASFLNALMQGQWSPLLTAAAVVPALGWIWAAKPSIGAALFAAFPSRRALAGCLLLTGIAMLVFPAWPFRWREALGQTELYLAPVVRPGGVVLLLALLRWREREGRLLAALACIPHLPCLYDTLPLFLIARTRWQGYALAALSYVAAFAQMALAPRLPGMSLEATVAARWPYILAFLYVPALVILLLPRPGRTEGREDERLAELAA
jgi:hypothetical protein